MRAKTKDIIKHVVDRLNWYEDHILTGNTEPMDCHGCKLNNRAANDCRGCPFACYGENAMDDFTKCRTIINNRTIHFSSRYDPYREEDVVNHYKALRKSCEKWAKNKGYILELADIKASEYKRYLKGELRK